MNTTTTRARIIARAPYVMRRAHQMCRATIARFPGADYRATLAAALRIAWSEDGKRALDIWTAYSDEEKYNALLAMAGAQYRRRDARFMVKNGRLVHLPSVFEWVDKAAPLDDLRAVAHEAYIILADYLTDPARASWTLESALARSVIRAAEKTDRAERRNPKAARPGVDRDGNQIEIIQTSSPTAEAIAPAPEAYAVLKDMLEHAAGNDPINIDIMMLTAAGYAGTAIAPVVGLAPRTVYKRLEAIRARYAEYNAG